MKKESILQLFIEYFYTNFFKAFKKKSKKLENRKKIFFDKQVKFFFALNEFVKFSEYFRIFQNCLRILEILFSKKKSRLFP